MLQQALVVPGHILHPIGEDSGFFDMLKAHGGAAGVDTDLIVGHIDDYSILPEKFIEHAREARLNLRKMLGVYE